MNQIVQKSISECLNNFNVFKNLKSYRLVATSAFNHGSFKVQDDKEFLEKVQNSKEPVIVDFFAK